LTAENPQPSSNSGQRSDLFKDDTTDLERDLIEALVARYRIHNYHFLVYGAMFDGQSEVALQTARDQSAGYCWNAATLTKQRPCSETI
jgi:hypothetical protein